jgi:two-component system nitrogen regulation sensor histidine kinase NtrY
MGTKASRRKVLSIVLGSALVLLLSVWAILNAFSLTSINPTSLDEILVFIGLSVLVFLLFVTVLVLLVRNVIKLYAEQRSRVLGRRLRTRMLWGALMVSLVPIVFMVAFSYGLMNRAVDRWFSQPVTEMRDDANHMAAELANYTTANARVEADAIAASLPGIQVSDTRPATSRSPKPAPSATPDPATQASIEAINRILRQHETTLQGGFVVVYREGRVLASYHLPQPSSAGQVREWLRPGLPLDDEDANASKITDPPAPPPALDSPLAASAILLTAQRSDQPILSIGPIDYALGTAGVKGGATVVAGLPVPNGLAATMTRMRTSSEKYWTLYRERRQIRAQYLILLAMMTCVALFASSWLALNLARQVTQPVESLADAMGAVAAGDYARRVDEGITEELGELIRSFNHMAGDLESSRAQVDQSTLQLNAVNATLEARRAELETMLETIPNGVATLDVSGRIVLANRALSEMIDPGGQRPFIGRQIQEIFPPEIMEPLEGLMRRSHRMGTASGEMEIGGHSNGNGNGSAFLESGATMNLLVTVALLEGKSSERTHHGYVVVLENATELLRAQKQSAWKEVARRVAHEIKNPLTPISLSAEQIRRHIDRLAVTISARDLESPSTAVIRRCSEVITSSVESMRSLVDQFASLAEFPTARPRPADLNTIVENSLALFAGRLQSIRLVRRLAVGLPLVMADPESMKRALGNLIDNAAEAMQQSLVREIRIETTLLSSGMVELTIADSGAGLTDEMRERLFLPYFSTKQRGTGLGLAIAAKIIQEHQGTIRAESNVPAGAKFIIELKPVSHMDSNLDSNGLEATPAIPELTAASQPEAAARGEL